MAKHRDGTRRNVTNQVLLENILTWKLSGSQHGLKMWLLIKDKELAKKPTDQSISEMTQYDCISLGISGKTEKLSRLATWTLTTVDFSAANTVGSSPMWTRTTWYPRTRWTHKIAHEILSVKKIKNLETFQFGLGGHILPEVALLLPRVHSCLRGGTCLS